MNITLKVAVVIHNSKQETLLIKEKYYEELGFKWNLVKGTYDSVKETIEECAKREIKEEVGFNIENLSLKKICHYGNDLNKKILFIFHAIYIGNEKPTRQNNQSNESILELKWFSKKELRQLPKDAYMASYVYEALLGKKTEKEIFV